MEKKELIKTWVGSFVNEVDASAAGMILKRPFNQIAEDYFGKLYDAGFDAGVEQEKLRLQLAKSK